MLVRANIEYQAWESKFFSLSTARLLAFDQIGANIITTELLNQYQLVQANIPAACTTLLDQLSRLQFQLVEGDVELEWRWDSTPINTRLCLQVAEYCELDRIRRLAQCNFHFSRFRMPWYTSTDSGRFYACWAEKALTGEFDDICLVLRNQQHDVQGMITLRKLTAHQARVGLLAVDKMYQGQGLGHQLIEQAKIWCYQQGISTLLVSTQMANIQALRFYLKQGAMITRTAYWLYRRQNIVSTLK